MLKVALLFQLVGFVWITWFLLGLSNVRTYENKIMVEHFLKQIMLRKISFKGQKLITVGLNQYSLLLSVVNKYSNRDLTMEHLSVYFLHIV